MGHPYRSQPYHQVRYPVERR
ncbi:hypothetical protein D046_4603A, partial [Vibrio parahaemolyticus V-223/04]